MGELGEGAHGCCSSCLNIKSSTALPKPFQSSLQAVRLATPEISYRRSGSGLVALRRKQWSMHQHHDERRQGKVGSRWVVEEEEVIITCRRVF